MYKRFAVHSNPPVVTTGVCDPNKSPSTTPAQYSFSQKTSSYKPHLTQHYEKYTSATQLKTVFTLQIFQKTCLWLMSDKALALPFLCTQKSKCLYIIYSCKSPWENFCYRDIGSFYLVGGGWMVFSRQLAVFIS